MTSSLEQSAHDDSLRIALTHAMREKHRELSAQLERLDSHWGVEDAVYRFYHQSFKVYAAQAATLQTVGLLQSLLPERPLNAWFTQIIRDGTGHTFDPSHNKEWLTHTRPILEALFHAHYFLKMACRYATEFESMPQLLPSGFAALLYLFDLR